MTGIPGAGKSCYVRHLATISGYFPFVLEEIGRERPPIPDEAEVLRLWHGALRTGDASRLPSEEAAEHAGLRSRGVGFPVNEPCIRCVESMVVNGIRLLWFECPGDVARVRFVKRDTVRVSAFDVQEPTIRSNYDDIMGRLHPEVIQVLRDDGTAKTVEEIAKQIAEG